MRAKEFICEGGWDTVATQKTVITPAVVSNALAYMQKFVTDFNRYSSKKILPPIKIGHPLGSSAYHAVDAPDRIYGDIDLQIVVSPVKETDGMSMAQIQSFWNTVMNEFVTKTNLKYVHKSSKPGHIIISAGEDLWVQVDMLVHPENLATWGRFRSTPEQGWKGFLTGIFYSLLGDLLMLSIQSGGVQFKSQNGIRQPFSITRKDYELGTITTNIERYALDIFNHDFQEATGRDPATAKIDPLLKKYPGLNIKQVRMSDLVNATKGLARSFELNNMYGHNYLKNYRNAQDFINAFLKIYNNRIQKDLTNPKRDKAATSQAIIRAEAEKANIIQGFELVKKLFQQ